jgi:hypothetical protein
MNEIERIQGVEACCSLPSGGFLLSKNDLTIVKTSPRPKTIEVKNTQDYVLTGNLMNPQSIHICTISNGLVARYFDSDLIPISQNVIDISSVGGKCFILDATIYTFDDYQRIAILMSDASISILDKGEQKERITLNLFSLTSRLLYHLDSFMISVSNEIIACSTTDLSTKWSSSLDSEIMFILPYTESNLLVLTESYLYILNEHAITNQLSMTHGVPSFACVNPMSCKVILIGTHDCKVLIYGPSLSLDWVIKTTSIPQSICISPSFGYDLKLG